MSPRVGLYGVSGVKSTVSECRGEGSDEGTQIGRVQVECSLDYRG